uniref:E3 ubiquitin-protein ligase TRIM71-like n=1 Tax=Crassostrea virginica TaxID=6565 RepID=A0A8B8AC02_CRAVI|nr:E3 ubiquitin-protein ligase TRIM71-like [Crassostrea virginica]XP_022288690.1 E3 ubiquitin-protein ligase TRIM71-like [Crassostrea virginica]
MEQQQQCAIKCDLCDTIENAIKFCKHCRETMCEHCSEIHTKSIASKDHEIILRSQASSFDILDDMKCFTHRSKLCEMYCVTCDKVVCTKCVTEDHRGHEFAALDKLFNMKPKEFDFLHKTFQEQVTPRYLKEREMLQRQLSEIEENHQAAETEIQSQAETLRNGIDTVEEKFKRMLTAIMDNEKLPIKKMLASRETSYANLQKAIKEMRILLENRHLSNIPLRLENIRQRLSALSLDDNFTICTEKHLFEKSDISQERLETFFGQFTVGTAGDVRKRTLPPVKLTVFIRKAIKKTGVHSLSSVIVVNETDLLICHKVFGFLINKESGQVQREVFQSSGLHEPAVMLSNGLLMARDRKSQNKVIKILANQVRSVFLDLNSDVITGLHLTRKNEILLSMVQEEDCAGEVLKFNKAGQAALRIYQKETGEALFAYPTSLTENLNEDIWVVDIESNSIEIVDKFGLYRFSYKDSDILKNFKPHSLTCDSNGNVLITDTGNDTIHVVDRDGRALRYLDTHSLGIQPTGIAVEGPGLLWALDSDKNTCYLLNYF